MVADGPPPEQPPLNIVEVEDSEDQPAVLEFRLEEPEDQWVRQEVLRSRRMGVLVEAAPTTDSFPHFHCRMT